MYIPKKSRAIYKGSTTCRRFCTIKKPDFCQYPFWHFLPISQMWYARAVFLIFNLIVLLLIASVGSAISKFLIPLMFLRCYVGKRRLETAMKALQEEADFKVTWKPFFLNPNTPKEGIPLVEYISSRYGAEAGRKVRDGKSPLVRVGKELVSFSF